MTEVPQHAFDDAAQILESAISGDSAAVADTFDAVVDRDGVVGAWDVAWCLAATMVGQMPGGGGAWTLEFPGIDEAQYDKRWVARFVSAYVNGDFPTSEALFGAAIADGQLPDCLLALAGSTVATLRRRAA
ncbi:hypothetical protein ACQP2E_00675 [Actinoplanes sp. CA-015351]|uniref:Uncharacterized protein n=1 Tax=Actinoplanes lutulentus TaxID=1287878 RepID=A0A327ZA66_9ACTN|nr:hypothetical protein [Actinoplanes lutulentus]MBB2944944.1 hypothetical protein [Actinoplanes lutulentus]RAK35268.1 hypothetical protein B0I29_11020 [Actinoplanes lutulentus]